MRKGRSAAEGWGVGAADSSDGWLRPLGGRGGPASPRGGWPQRPRSREPRRRAGESRNSERTCSKPLGSKRVSAPTAARPQCPCRGAGDSAAGTPFLRPNWGSLAELKGKAHPCPALATSLLAQD